VRVPLTTSDFITRAEIVYPDRIAIVDEPDQPAESWGSIDYREMARRSRAIAAGLDALGIEVGERVAIVSHNSARLLTALFGVTGSGRILVPVNFRLVAEEISYIVEHSGARVLLVDPEIADALDSVACEMKFVIGAESDAELMRFDVDPRGWDGRDRDRQLHLGYHGAAEGSTTLASQHLAERLDLRMADGC
jgi:fatty-acyl-CoA synthase